MAYIPPGSQEPFDKERAYGQEEGFVSRHSGKIIVGLVVVVVILAIAVVTFAINNSDDDSSGVWLNVEQAESSYT